MLRSCCSAWYGRAVLGPLAARAAGCAEQPVRHAVHAEAMLCSELSSRPNLGNDWASNVNLFQHCSHGRAMWRRLALQLLEGSMRTKCGHACRQNGSKAGAAEAAGAPAVAAGQVAVQAAARGKCAGLWTKCCATGGEVQRQGPTFAFVRCAAPCQAVCLLLFSKLSASVRLNLVCLHTEGVKPVHPRRGCAQCMLPLAPGCGCLLHLLATIPFKPLQARGLHRNDAA